MSLAQAVSTQMLWLLGHGVQRSPSPAMQNAALRACGLQDWRYEIHDVAPAELGAALAEMRAGAARGANVTIPHKRAVAAACDELAGDARLTGAVNTVIVRDGRLVGDNTDALGLEGALRHQHAVPPPGFSAVVLGAGGAASAAVLAATRCGAAGVSVVARRAEAAAAVSGATAAVGWDTEAVAAALGQARDPLLVNATPAGLGDLPLDLDRLPPTCTVVDLRYRPRPVDLVAAARERGLPACDGLEMLLHQGMLSFERWTGLPAPWDAARAALDVAVSAP